MSEQPPERVGEDLGSVSPSWLNIHTGVGIEEQEENYREA